MRRRDALAAAGFLLGASSAAASRAADAFVKDPAFYGEWSYSQPSDIIPYVKATAAGRRPGGPPCHGHLRAVLSHVQTRRRERAAFSLASFASVLRGGAWRWALSSATAPSGQPRTSRGRHADVRGFEPRHVEVRALTTYAGVSDRVEILQGAGSERVPDLVERFGKGTPADMIFMDPQGVLSAGSEAHGTGGSRRG